jgi:phosphatidylserine decarboxylase
MEPTHQYIERFSGRICNEPLFGDRIVHWLYHPLREKAPQLFKLLTGARTTQLLGFFNYDLALASRVLGNRRFFKEAGVAPDECLDPVESLNTARKVFERKIRYQRCRPMPEDPRSVVSPADARVIVGALEEVAALQIKGKFFAFEELLGAAGVPLAGVMVFSVLMLALCVPASRLVARLVEGKAHTFTVGGAVFVGIVAAPWLCCWSTG